MSTKKFDPSLPLGENASIKIITKELLVLLNEQRVQDMNDRLVERNLLYQIEKGFLHILNTTTLTERLFEDGPRKYSITFGNMVYCGIDDEEQMKRDLKAGNPQMPAGNTNKNLMFVSTRENKIPTPEEAEKRRKDRLDSLRHVLDHLFSPENLAKKTVFVDEKAGTASVETVNLGKSAKPNPFEPEETVDETIQRVGRQIRDKVSNEITRSAMQHDKDFRDVLIHRAQHAAERTIPQGEYKIEKLSNAENDNSRIIAQNNLYNGRLKRIENYPKPGDVMKMRGNEWLNYAQALEYTIEKMRSIAAGLSF